LLLVRHSSLLGLLLTIDLYLRLRYHPHHLLLVMLRRRCYLILFVTLFYLRYLLVQYLASLVPFVSLFLILGLTRLLRIFHLELLIRLMLHLLISYLLLFSLVQRLLPLALPLTIVLYLKRRYYLHHSPLVTLRK